MKTQQIEISTTYGILREMLFLKTSKTKKIILLVYMLLTQSGLIQICLSSIESTVLFNPDRNFSKIITSLGRLINSTGFSFGNKIKILEL